MFKKFCFAMMLAAAAAIASGVLQMKMIDVENDPIFYEACVYPISPEYDCCPKHAELHKEKESKIQRLWNLAVIINGVSCMIAGSIICEAAKEKK